MAPAVVCTQHTTYPYIEQWLTTTQRWVEKHPQSAPPICPIHVWTDATCEMILPSCNFDRRMDDSLVSVAISQQSRSRPARGRRSGSLSSTEVSHVSDVVFEEFCSREDSLGAPSISLSKVLERWRRRRRKTKRRRRRKRKREKLETNRRKQSRTALLSVNGHSNARGASYDTLQPHVQNPSPAQTNTRFSTPQLSHTLPAPNKTPPDRIAISSEHAFAQNLRRTSLTDMEPGGQCSNLCTRKSLQHPSRPKSCGRVSFTRRRGGFRLSFWYVESACRLGVDMYGKSVGLVAGMNDGSGGGGILARLFDASQP